MGQVDAGLGDALLVIGNRAGVSSRLRFSVVMVRISGITRSGQDRKGGVGGGSVSVEAAWLIAEPTQPLTARSPTHFDLDQGFATLKGFELLTPR